MPAKELLVTLREVDYHSNPSLFVTIVVSLAEARVNYDMLLRNQHEKYVVQPKGLLKIDHFHRKSFILRPEVWARAAAKEPVYPQLVQEGTPVGLDESLSVFLSVLGYQLRYGNRSYEVATIPEIIVMTAASEQEAKNTLATLSPNHESLVRTAKPPTGRGFAGDFIQVNRKIRQTFILRPQGNADL